MIVRLLTSLALSVWLLVCCGTGVVSGALVLDVSTVSGALNRLHSGGAALSTTIDWSIVLDYPWTNFTHPRFIQLATNLVTVVTVTGQGHDKADGKQDGTPLIIRVGGTRGDVLYYDMSGVNPPPPPPAPYQRAIGTVEVDRICTLAQQIGAGLYFGVNAGEGPRARSNGSVTAAPTTPRILSPVSHACVCLFIACMQRMGRYQCSVRIGLYGLNRLSIARRGVWQ
jgi:hypothetical protein